MKFSEEHTFEAPIDRVWAMFGDPASHVAKFESMGHRDVEIVEQDVADDRVRLVIRRVVETDLPGFAKKVLKPTNTVTTTDEWERKADGSCGGRYTVDAAGAPVKVAGSTQLTADGDRTVYRVTVDVDVKVPLIGRKLADWAKGNVAEQLQMEFDAGDRWLADHG